jgi:hypothetical protein
VAGAFEYDDSLANEVTDGLPKYLTSVRICLVDDSRRACRSQTRAYDG